MKKYIIFLLCFGCCIVVEAQIHITDGATLTIKSGAITLNKIDLENNGTFNAQAGTLLFISDKNQNINGIGNSIFNDITLKMGENDVLLNQNIAVNGIVLFESGQFDLNGKDVNLGINGLISGETDATSFIGSTGGEIIFTQPLNNPNLVNPANLGLQLSTLENLGNTTIKRGHQAQQVGMTTGINRYFEVIPTNNIGLNATVNFMYLDSELNGIEETELNAWQAEGAGWLKQSVLNVSETTNVVDINQLSSLGRLTLAKAAYSPSVTFKVKMAGLVVPAEGVHIAGAFQSEAGYPEDWNPATTQLTDADADDIYEITLTLTGVIPGESYRYKFINGNDWAVSEGVPPICGMEGDFAGIYDRFITIPTDGTSTIVLAPVCFGGCDTNCGNDVDYCSPSAPVYSVENNPEFITATTHQANTIESTGTVASNSTVTFRAANTITLKSGFHAQANSDFHALIGDCTTTRLTADSVVTTTTKVQLSNEIASITETVKLSQNVPNPFTGNTEINYYLPPSTNQASLYLVDLMGRSVNDFLLKETGAGRIIIEGNTLQPGVYFYTMVVNGKRTVVKKMMLIK